MKVECPRCGSNVVFMPSSQTCNCEHCKSDISLEEMHLDSFDVNSDISYDECTCSSCGAKLLTDENTTISKCVYCGSTQIIKNRFQGKFMPDGIIPFEIDYKGFLKRYEQYISNKVYLPHEYRENYVLKDIKGVYVPAYVYQYQLKGNSCGCASQNGGDSCSYRYYRLKNQFEVQMTLDALGKIKDSYINSLKPFDYTKMRPFHPVFLCGFSASNSDEKEDYADKKVKAIRTEVYKEHLIQDLGYGWDLDYGLIQLKHKLLKKSYILLPIWFFNTEYCGQTYSFAVNGQSGEICGELPIDKSRLLKNIIVGLVLFLVFFWFFSALFMNDVLSFGVSSLLCFLSESLVLAFLIKTCMQGYASRSSLKHETMEYTDGIKNHIKAEYEEYSKAEFYKKYGKSVPTDQLKIIDEEIKE